MAEVKREEYVYDPPETIIEFHKSPARHRAIVGSVGSGKTSAGAWEVCHYLPYYLHKEYGIKETKWVVVRNVYRELVDTTQATVFYWFPWGEYKVQEGRYTLRYPDGIVVDLLFRACDRPEDVKKFKSLEVTGAWIDESIEVAEAVKLLLKGRAGRFPAWAEWCKSIKERYPKKFGKMSQEEISKWAEENPDKILTKFSIHTTNPPDIEHPLYHQFAWISPPPGPVPEGQVLEGHVGFWQKPMENSNNLVPGYYDDLRKDYADNPDWIDIYIDGKPGTIAKGRMVYANFKRKLHVAEKPLVWSGGHLFRGWDNSGNCPACVVVQIPTAGHIQVIKEYTTDKLNIAKFAYWVVTDCATSFPGAKFTDYGDPAGANKFSTRDGTFTSNAQIMREECGVSVLSSEQNLTARINAVDGALARIDGLLIDPGCTRLINGFLGGYCYKEIGNSGVYSDNPEKNRFSHIHDSLQYVLIKLSRSIGSGGVFQPKRETVAKVIPIFRRRNPRMRKAWR